jgi:hypothetical protein
MDSLRMEKCKNEKAQKRVEWSLSSDDEKTMASGILKLCYGTFFIGGYYSIPSYPVLSRPQSLLI